MGKINPCKLWISFKNEFVNSIKSNIEDDTIKAARIDNIAWKKLIKEDILEDIAKNLKVNVYNKLFNIEIENKLFIADVIMSVRHKTNFKVPIIFIEIENDNKNAEKKIDKLCAIKAPLRVMITKGPVNDEDEFFDAWATLITAYDDILGNNGILGLIVIDWGERISIKTMAWYEGEFESEPIIYQQ